MKISKTLTIIGALVLILLLAIATRFYKLGQAPAGLYLDEAGQGYSAYSILKTGKDEFGKSFPIVFRSFTDFKTPVYIYLIVPLINIFGLNAFTVRFPSFFFSILTFPILFLLLRKISPSKILLSLSLLTSLLLAISPWHILFGRINFECNVALFFFLSGIYLFYLGLKKPYLLLFSAAMFAIAIPSYHSQRIITPFIVVLFFLRHKKILLSKTHQPYLLMGLLIGLIITLPTLSVALTPGFLARAAGLNIFSARQLPAGFIENYHGVFVQLVNNRFLLSLKEFLSLYVSYFSPRSMFLLGDSGPRSSFPELATFFFWQFPFYLWGLYTFLKEKALGELKFFTLALLLIAPIPAAVTRDPYSTIRSLPLVIPQTIIISFGLMHAYNFFVKSIPRTIIFAVFLLTILYSLAKLYSSVIILNEYFRAPYWNYGWQEAAAVIKNKDPILPVVVDTARSEAYIQLAFFLKFDPATFQKENPDVPLSQYYTNLQRKYERRLGDIDVRFINWEKDLKVEQYLVGDELAISQEQIVRHHLSLIKEVDFPDGSVALRIVKTNP